MAFTDDSDLYGSLHEEGINIVVQHIMRQRPSLFNYGTALVAANLELLCKPIDPVQAVFDRGNPIITVEEPLPVLGTSGMVRLNFCFQLTKVEIDFHPGNVFALPMQLSPPLAGQHFSIYARVCAGLGCPSKDFSDEIQIYSTPFVKTQLLEPPPSIVVPTRELECFCLDLFVVGHIEVIGPKGNQRLIGKVDGLEIVDIEPEGLENILECYLDLLIRMVILPRLSVALESVVFDILNLATVTISASPTVANNPAIEDDQVKVFIDMEVSP